MIESIERMRKLVNDNLVMGLRFQMNRELNELEREIEQELNSRAERTCKMETDHDELEVIAYSHEDTWAYKCSACGWSFRYDRGIKPNYCPSCGCKVVG